MNGEELLQALKDRYQVDTDVALASKMGLQVTTIQKLRIRPKITAAFVASLIDHVGTKAHKSLQATAIRPLVEFYKIDKCHTVRSGKFQVFDVKDESNREHPYRLGLKNELEQNNGIYIFFDSRGRAIYTGKAKRQKLWRELNLAFNRDRRSVQKIKLVDHPESRVQYRTSDQKARQIRDHVLALHEISAYFSAYEVEDGMIDELESLLIRTFANDLLNIRMERFSRQRKKSQP